MSNLDETKELTPAEMCQELNVSMPTIYRRVKAGLLVPVPKPAALQRHHRLRFAPSEVKAYYQRLLTS